MSQPHRSGVRDADPEEPREVRRLRLLVTALMVVLILGIVIVVAVLVIRLGVVGAPERPGAVTAGELVLPEGAEAVALGRAAGQVLVLTRDAAGSETLRVFDDATGAEISATPVRRE